MGIVSKVLVSVGLVAIDMAILLLAIKLLFKKGLRAWISGIVLVIGGLLLGAGVFLIPKAPGVDSAQVSAQTQSNTGQAQTNSGEANQVIKDIHELFHKSPAEIEKILGKPNGPIVPLQGGNHTLKLKSGKQVPVTVGSYLGETVQINFLDGTAGHIWITLKEAYKYPEDKNKLLALYGIPQIQTPARVTPFSVDWENSLPGIYKVQFGMSEGRINDLGVVFLGAEDIAE